MDISRDTFYPLYKKARTAAYTSSSIASAFKACGIVPFSAREVLHNLKLQAPDLPSDDPDSTITLGRTPYTHCELRQFTAYHLNFAKTATPGQICNMILRFSHTAESALTETNIDTHDMARLQNEIKLAKPRKKDMPHIKGGRILKGEQILAAIREREKKDKKKVENKRKGKKKVPQQIRSVPVTPKHPRVRFQQPPRQYSSSSDTSTGSKTSSSNSSKSLLVYRPSTHPRVEPVLHTPQNPNRRLSDRPLGMSLRTRK